MTTPYYFLYKCHTTLTTFLILLFSSFVFVSFLFLKPPLSLHTDLFFSSSSSSAHPPINHSNHFHTPNATELSHQTHKDQKHEISGKDLKHFFDTASQDISDETGKDQKHFEDQKHLGETNVEETRTANKEVSEETGKEQKHFGEISETRKENQKHLKEETNLEASEEETGKDAVDRRIEELRNCDLYNGIWEKDKRYPIYREGSCQFVDEAFDCKSNGRTDFNYLSWRWKPHSCHLPMYSLSPFVSLVFSMIYRF